VQEKLFNLRVVPIDHVSTHEHYDPARVSDLAAQLRCDDTLVNPVIAVEWKDLYVVLDGATRVAAFRQLGYPHIIAQIISQYDEGLKLRMWNHVVCGPTEYALLRHLQGVSTCILTTNSQQAAQSALHACDTLCSIVFNDGQHYLVHPSPGENHVRALNALVAAYTEVGSIIRTVSTDLGTVRSEVPELTALVLFPQWELLDVVRGAVGGQIMPAGITRFIVPGRVLRLHADLPRLRAHEPIENKNAWLDSLLTEKWESRGVRYYQEPVILLDE